MGDIKLQDYLVYDILNNVHEFLADFLRTLSRPPAVYIVLKSLLGIIKEMLKRMNPCRPIQTSRKCTCGRWVCS